MPVELSALLGGEAWVTVEVGGGTIEVAYHPGGLSLIRTAQIQKMARAFESDTATDEEVQAEQVAQVFCEMICAWDVEKGGQPYPITPATIGALPRQLVIQIMSAVAEDVQAQQQEKKRLSVTSGAGLPQTTRQELARNGTPSSAPRGTWA